MELCSPGIMTSQEQVKVEVSKSTSFVNHPVQNPDNPEATPIRGEKPKSLTNGHLAEPDSSDANPEIVPLKSRSGFRPDLACEAVLRPDDTLPSDFVDIDPEVTENENAPPNDTLPLDGAEVTETIVSRPDVDLPLDVEDIAAGVEGLDLTPPNETLGSDSLDKDVEVMSIRGEKPKSLTNGHLGKPDSLDANPEIVPLRSQAGFRADLACEAGLQPHSTLPSDFLDIDPEVTENEIAPPDHTLPLDGAEVTETIVSRPDVTQPSADVDIDADVAALDSTPANETLCSDYADLDVIRPDATLDFLDLSSDSSLDAGAAALDPEIDLEHEYTVRGDLDASRSVDDIILPSSTQKSYDYLLKVLLVGDSDVGKQEILSELEDGTTESPFCSSEGAAFKQTTLLIDGKRVKLQLWDTSGQGRFCTILRSYSRGAQGILLVYDITNKWSFEGINRWRKEVDQHAPGIPKVLIGNRLHLAFKREVDQEEAEQYAEKNSMGFFEVSPLVNFNISESFVELARMALKRNGMERLWRSNKVTTLYEMCAHTIVDCTTVYGIARLPLPESVKENLKSYALTNYSTMSRSQCKSIKYNKGKKVKKRSSWLGCEGVFSKKACVIS